MNNASQTCQDYSDHLKTSTMEGKKNEKLISTENVYNCEKEGNVSKDSNTVSHEGVRLEDKFVHKHVISLSRRNLFASEISWFSKGLKLLPTAKK